MKSILKKCIEGDTLSQLQAEEAMDAMMQGEATDSQIASLVSILRFRGETVDELIGFAKAMKKHMIQIDGMENVIDTCGTGGDGANTFNISTASAILTSSLGVKVAKHGNRSVSSKSGSADVLEYLNIPIQSSPEEARDAIEQSNMSFLYAPLYHSSMRYVAKTRKEIGFRTFFNLLGPLVNPAKAKKQVIGVYSLSYAQKLAHALQHSDSEHVLFVTGNDGLDEMTITGKTNVIEVRNGTIQSYEITPEQMGLSRGELKDIQVQNVQESAELIERIFRNEANEAARNIVLLNASAALYVAGAVRNLHQGVAMAKKALEDGVALRHLQALQVRKEEKYA